MASNHRPGIALIIVMIVVSGLSILAFGLAYRAKVRIKTFGLNTQNVKAYHLALGGIEKGKVFLSEEIFSDEDQYFDLNIAKKIPFIGQMSDHEISLLSEKNEKEQRLGYAVFDEICFININKTNPVNLIKLEQIDEITVSKIIDWKDKDDEPSLAESVESDYYLQQKRPFKAKNEDMSHLRELLFIKGIDVKNYLGRLSNTNSDDKFNFFAESYDGSSTGLVNLFSVHGDGMLNINTVPAVILASLPGIEMQDAEMLVDYRNNLASDEYLSSDAFLTEIDLDPVQRDSIANNCVFSSNIFRIYSFCEVKETCCCLMAIVKYDEKELKTLSLERLF